MTCIREKAEDIVMKLRQVEVLQGQGKSVSDMIWNEEIDALEFRPTGYEFNCVIHRLAFRALLQLHNPEVQECLVYATGLRRVFDAVAISKAKRTGLKPGARFHITSRDVRTLLNPSSSKPVKKIASQRTQKNP
jgi:hypothetical protein